VRRLLCPNGAATCAAFAHNFPIGSAKDKNMKATEVRILPARDAGETYVDPVFLLVETTVADDGETVTTIDHISSGTVDGMEGWVITTLGQSVPTTHAAACEWAVTYAASRGIPLVYERDETASGTYAATPSGAFSAPNAASSSK
jgi:hypothetical protein